RSHGICKGRSCGLLPAKARKRKKSDAGHIHYWIDDETNIMTYPATTETSITLLVPPARHKIRAELVLDDHTSLANAHQGKAVFRLPPDPTFEQRPTISTVTINVE